MKLSLGAILAIWLSGLQFVAVLSVVSFYFVSSERVLLDHATTLIGEVGRSSTEHSKGFLEPAIRSTELAKRLMESDIVKSDDTEELEKLLFQQMQVVPQLSGIYYGDDEGNFVYVMRSEEHAEFRTKLVHRSGDDVSTELIWRDKNYKIAEIAVDPEDKFDPRVRPWYMDAKKEQNFVWTSPYIFFSSQRPGITAATPILSASGQFEGVIGVDIEIDEITRFLSSLDIGDSGVAMALSGERDVIAHPTTNFIRETNKENVLQFIKLDQLEDAVAREAFGSLPRLDQVTSEQEIESEFQYNDGKYASILIPGSNHDLPWSIAIYAPLSDFIGGIEENRTRNIWIAMIIAMVTGLIGLQIANRINKPIRDFAIRAGLVASGDVSKSNASAQTYPELEEVSETLASEIAQRKTFERIYGRTFSLASRGMAQISPSDGHFIRVNQQLADILGYTTKEMVDMSINDILHPEDADSYISFQKTMHDDYEYNQEKRYVRKNGDIVWLQVNAFLIRDQKGEALYAVATIDNKTAQKDAESKINELSRDLSHFSRVNMMGQMAEGLAHELNQPLTSITQNVDAALLTVNEQPNADPELVEILEDMDRQAHHGAEIIRALRGLVRKDEGEQTKFDLTELLDQTLQLLKPEANEFDISISFAPKTIPHVFGNRVQVAQVVMNLTRNAIEAVETANAKERKIVIETNPQSDCIEVHVIDTGPGIDPNVDLFAQFESSKRDGMGLGLSLSRTLIEANGGKIWYEPKIKGRSRFCFTIPTAVIN
jgi:PAS domain S-box-containing protein